MEELMQAYKDCIKHKRNTVNAIKFEADELYNLAELLQLLNDKSYSPGRSIAFICFEPKPREIFAADFRDRVVLHLIINRILQHIEDNEWIIDTYSTRKNKGTLYGAKRLYEQIMKISNNGKEQTYIMKLDLQNCFISIDKNKVYDKIIKFLANYILDKDEYEFNCWLLNKIIFSRCLDNCIRKQPAKLWDLKIEPAKSLFNVKRNLLNGFPVGNITSLILVNFYLSSLDKFIINLGFNCYKWCPNSGYGRYVDDFFLIHKDKQTLLNAKLKIIDFVKSELGMLVNPNKVYIQEVHKGVNFIGYCIKPGRIYVHKRTIRNFKRKLTQWNKYFKHMILTKLEIPLEQIKSCASTINSYLGLMSHCNTYNIRKSILRDKGLTYYLNGYIYRCHGYKKVKVGDDLLWKTKSEIDYQILG